MSIEDKLDRIETTLRIRIPFISSLVRECRIMKTESELPGPVGVSSEGYIIINPEQFEKLEYREQCFAIAHEAMHIANLHNLRGNDKNKMAWNFATDGSVNNLLDSIMNKPNNVISLSTLKKIIKGANKSIGIGDLQEMADFEIYQMMPKPQGQNGPRGGSEGNGEGQGESEGDGQGQSEDNEYSGKGESDVTRGENGEGDLLDEDPDDMETVKDGADFNDSEIEKKKEEWNKAISRAAMNQKLAGDMPAGLERYVDDILKPDLNIKSLIKQFIQNGIGNLRINNWRRPSRKHPLLPGTKMLSTPTIWCLVDTSGSIGKEELELFLGTAYEFASRADIKVIPWDAESYTTLEARNKSQVIEKVGKQLEGGGGTKIIPPLKKVNNEMEARDIVSIMTDGHIYDSGEEEARDLFDSVSSRSSSAFICSTDATVDVPGWKCLNIK